MNGGGINGWIFSYGFRHATNANRKLLRISIPGCVPRRGTQAGMLAGALLAVVRCGEQVHGLGEAGALGFGRGGEFGGGGRE